MVAWLPYPPLLSGTTSLALCPPTPPALPCVVHKLKAEAQRAGEGALPSQLFPAACFPISFSQIETLASVPSATSNESVTSLPMPPHHLPVLVTPAW